MIELETIWRDTPIYKVAVTTARIPDWNLVRLRGVRHGDNIAAYRPADKVAWGFVHHRLLVRFLNPKL